MIAFIQVKEVIIEVQLGKEFLWGRWSELLRTQLKEFVPVYEIPDYSNIN